MSIILLNSYVKVPTPAAHSIVWANLANASVIAANQLQASSGIWNGGGSSSESISGDGYVELTIDHSAQNRMFGLGTTNTGGSYTRINFAIFMFYTDIQLFESGAGLSAYGPFINGDVFRVERVGTTIYYKKNGSTLYTSGVSSSGTLYANGAIENTNLILENITLSAEFA